MRSLGPIPMSKRIVDILLSTLILVITLPFTLSVLVLIFATNILRGHPHYPLFYSEQRYSHGKPFFLYKFNIFKYEQILEAKANGVFIETKYFEKNGGVTWIGWILKQIYMDELPQLYNVPRGAMTASATRPVNKQVFEKLMAEGVDHKRKVRAGITGNFQSYKQIAGKDANTLDQEYVEYYLHKPWYTLLWFDTKIILRTLKVIIKARGV